MSEYIKREDATDAFSQMYPSATKSFILDRLAEIPAADVEPVVRGYWMEEECFVCSHCGMPATWTKPRLKKQILSSFCCSCGAHMERSGSGE